MARSISGILESYSKSIEEKKRVIAEAEDELKKYQLTEEDRLRLGSIDLNSSHTDLLGPIRRLREIKSAPFVAEDESDLTVLLQSTNEKVSEWFERNISSIQLDSVDPSLGVLVGYLVEMNGLDWFNGKFSLRRSSTKQRDFSRAMTIGSNTKPIGLHVNMPVRYVSDILAWLHEAFASELDLIDLLLEETDRGSKMRIAAGILEPVTGDAVECIASVFGDLGSVSEILHVLLLVKYYEEWFNKRIPDGKISEALGSLSASLHPRTSTLLDLLYDTCLAESIDKQKLVPSPGLKRILDELIALHRVQKSCLGPSNSDQIYTQIQQSLADLMNKMFKIHLNSLEDYEVEILQLNCFDQLASQMPLPRSLEEIRAVSLSSLSSLLITRLFEKAMIDVSLADREIISSEQAAACLNNLNETFVLNSGWDFIKSEPRINGVADRHYLSESCSNRLIAFYTKAYDQISDPSPSIKSPETIKMLLLIEN